MPQLMCVNPCRMQSAPERINPAVLAQLPLEMQRELAESMVMALPKVGRRPAGQSIPEAELEASDSPVAGYVNGAECTSIWDSFAAAFEELATAPQTMVWRKQQTPGSNRSETESLAQSKARELAGMLVDWAQSLAQHNLESLQWVLRKLLHAATRWPALGSVMGDAAAELQEQTQQQLGAPVHISSICTAI